MKTTKFFLMVILLSFSNVFGLEAEEADLSVQDLAAFIQVRHKTFTFETDGNVTGITYHIDIYRNGQRIRTGSWSDFTENAQKREQKFSILYKDEGDSIRFVVRRNGFTHFSDLQKPEGVQGFPIVSSGVSFDEQGRLVLGFDVERNEQGGTITTPENSSVEGAKHALVFQIELH